MIDEFKAYTKELAIFIFGTDNIDILMQNKQSDLNHRLDKIVGSLLIANFNGLSEIQKTNYIIDLDACRLALESNEHKTGLTKIFSTYLINTHFPWQYTGSDISSNHIKQINKGIMTFVAIEFQKLLKHEQNYELAVAKLSKLMI